eukprot:TRINITY_DN15411_c0_g1_i1.p1 TRINITY_DN15411_c0_g1~~TRINITY_DN15411_c0_g1_i1.p1  ORF type:complete len:432 (+),score=76.91 TRINITY_DN15411_c0_g1_i1:37-1332(+)
MEHSLENLPEKILQRILSYVEAKELTRFEKICKRFWVLSRTAEGFNSDELWRTLYLSTFGHIENSIVSQASENKRWKELFAQRYREEKMTGSQALTPDPIPARESGIFTACDSMDEETEAQIKNVAAELSTKIPTFSFEITRLLAANDVPLVNLGRLRSSLSSLRLKGLVLSEIIVTSFGDDLMQKLMGTSSPKELVLTHLNLLLIRSDFTQEYYDKVLRKRIDANFPGSFSINEKSLHRLVNSTVFFQILRSLNENLRIEFSPVTHTRLLRSYPSERASRSLNSSNLTASTSLTSSNLSNSSIAGEVPEEPLKELTVEDVTDASWDVLLQKVQRKVQEERANLLPDENIKSSADPKASGNNTSEKKNEAENTKKAIDDPELEGGWVLIKTRKTTEPPVKTAEPSWKMKLLSTANRVKSEVKATFDEIIKS